MKKKKWYDTWWGLLWTLALVDAHPGQGLQKFMEVDEELKHLPEFEKEAEPVVQNRIKKPTIISPCPTGAKC